MDSFEWTKHKKFISEKNSNFQKTLNFTPPTILPQKTLRWTLLAPGRGLFKYEKKRFFCQVARKISKSDYITGPNRLEDPTKIFTENGSILNLKALKLLFLLLFRLIFKKKGGKNL